jgi:ribosome-associated protein
MPSEQVLELVKRGEVDFIAIRAQGSGGQNVNKVSSAIHLRMDIHASSLSEFVKERLLALRDHRITDSGILVIKAQSHRSQELNKADALDRLSELLESAAFVPKARKPTKVSYNARQRRLDSKSMRSGTKSLRGKVSID